MKAWHGRPSPSHSIFKSCELYVFFVLPPTGLDGHWMPADHILRRRTCKGTYPSSIFSLPGVNVYVLELAMLPITQKGLSTDQCVHVSTIKIVRHWVYQTSATDLLLLCRFFHCLIQSANKQYISGEVALAAGGCVFGGGTSGPSACSRSTPGWAEHTGIKSYNRGRANPYGSFKTPTFLRMLQMNIRVFPSCKLTHQQCLQWLEHHFAQYN